MIQKSLKGLTRRLIAGHFIAWTDGLSPDLTTITFPARCERSTPINQARECCFLKEVLEQKAKIISEKKINKLGKNCIFVQIIFY